MSIDKRPPSTATSGAARSGSAAAIGATIGAALAPHIGLDAVTAAGIFGSLFAALGAAVGKIARDRVHKGFGPPSILWSLLGTLL